MLNNYTTIDIYLLIMTPISKCSYNLHMKNIKLKMKGSLLDSIKWGDIEILNTTKNWIKKSPICFPAISLNKEYRVGDKTYQIPKHGFWNDIDFDVKESEEGVVLNGKVEHATYPFLIEAEQYILKGEDKVTYTSTFTGKDIPVQFGYHPAFNYDKGGLKINSKAICVFKDMTTVEERDINITNLSELPWDVVDTFIFELSELTLENEKYDLTVKSNMKYMAVWTNGDKYICLEPWSNLPATVTPNDNSKIDGSSYVMDIILKEKD